MAKEPKAQSRAYNSPTPHYLDPSGPDAPTYFREKMSADRPWWPEGSILCKPGPILTGTVVVVVGNGITTPGTTLSGENDDWKLVCTIAIAGMGHHMVYTRPDWQDVEPTPKAKAKKAGKSVIDF